MVNFTDLIEGNKRKAVVRLLTIRKIKNPDAVVKIADGVYEHTNSRGKTKQYRVYVSFNEYRKSGYYNGFRMERLMGFYIVVI
jgi:hypothetical protein